MLLCAFIYAYTNFQNIKRIRKQNIPLELLHNEKTSLIGNGAQYLSLRLASASTLALSE